MAHHQLTDLLLCWAPPVPLQVLAVSSAGAVFEQMRDVAPFTLAAWRLQLTSVILMCGALWQWRGMVSGWKPACEPLEWLLTLQHLVMLNTTRVWGLCVVALWQWTGLVKALQCCWDCIVFSLMSLCYDLDAVNDRSQSGIAARFE